ncbi:hypothetical protein [Pseudomonas oryzihabitans]|uniref:hypothetical protein n=1 Tax=Pseudomonas oryzihabitans TaxID=47885 RepID=UPI000A99DF8A|nr:hypothetical protein [Pseudomonas oryzihabitans]
MSNLIIESGDNANKVVVDNSGQTSLSMQQFQHVYAMFTGKSEEIVRTSNKPIRLELDDLYQLDTMFRQLLEQYKVAGLSAVYNIYHEGGEKGVYSSYEQFARSVGANSSATESIYFKYHVAIVLPQTQQPQNYIISIRCSNSLVLRRKMRNELPAGVPAQLLNLFSTKTVEIKVEYIDFAVARSVMSALDAWLTGLAVGEKSAALKALRERSSLIPVLFRYLGLAFMAWGLFGVIPKVLDDNGNLEILAKFSISAALLVFVGWKILSSLGGMVENFVDSTTEISHTNITRGDKNDLAAASKENEGYIKKAIIGGAVSGVASFCSKYLVALTVFVGG